MINIKATLLDRVQLNQSPAVATPSFGPCRVDFQIWITLGGYWKVLSELELQTIWRHSDEAESAGFKSS